MLKHFVILILLFIFTINIGFSNDIKPILISIKTNTNYIVNNYNNNQKLYGFDIKLDIINIIIIQTIYGNLLFYPINEN